MTLFRYENVSLIKLDSGDIYGFHNINLEVARISEDLWEASQNGTPCEELTELRSWSEFINPSAKKLVIEQKAKTLTVNTTQLCNLKCTYCAAGGDGTYGSPNMKLDLKKGLPQLEWLMARCLPGERFQINFLGGEPLLYPDVMHEIAEYAQQLSQQYQVAVRFAVVTNGTRLSDPIILDLLCQFRIAVTVSVDGPPHIQNKFRPKKSGKGESQESSQDLENGLSQLRSIRHKLPAIGLNAVFHKDHFDALETYKYFRNWDFDYYELTYSHTDFDPEASAGFCQSMEEVAQYADAQGGEDELRKIKTFDSIIHRLDEQLRVENFCGSGKSLLSMDAKGNVYACPWDINNTSMKLNSSNNLGVLSDKMAKYKEPQIAKNACQTCWAKFVCGGGCSYSHNQYLDKSNSSSGLNTLEKIDPVFCERMQSIIVTTIKFYEKYRRGE